MKRILIVNNNMHIGGVQKALISLICAIKDSYDVTLLLFNPAGKYMDCIPEGVKVISLSSGYRYLGMAKHDIKTTGDKLKRAFYAGITKFFGRDKAIRLMSVGQEEIGKYDVAISYLHNAGEKLFYGGCNDFVLRHVDAQKKIAFLHCDFEKCGANHPENEKAYSRFDNIAACSDGCGDSFIRAFPALKEKVVTVRNCHDFDSITDMANEETPNVSGKYINILTVARLGREKGVLRGVKSVAALGDFITKVRYYIIGDGIEREKITSYINAMGLQDHVILLGEKKNPYGYMKACDLLYITSYSEGAPLVIDECASLGTPILSTETSSSYDMIDRSGYGWVCENLEEAMTQALRKLIDDPGLITEKKKYINDIIFSNETAISQFEKVING